MNARGALKSAIGISDMVWTGYVQDLTEDEMFRRPCAGANHVTWQLGHLIGSERQLIEGGFPGSMPALPEGFAARYTKETAGSDDRSRFDSKDELLRVFRLVRAGTLAVIDKASETDLDRASPEAFRSYAPTLGDLLMLQPTHYLMHAGQWAVVRRMSGRPPLF
jgi:hypothetical protein